MLWFSLLVLIPLAAIVAAAAAGGWDAASRRAHRTTQTWAALRLTVVQARAGHAAQHRDGHGDRLGAGPGPVPGQALLNVIIDVPFALPTIVAGLVLLALYGPNSPIGIDVGQHPNARCCWRSPS